MEDHATNSDESGRTPRARGVPPGSLLSLATALLAVGVALGGFALGRAGGSGRGREATLTAASTGASPGATVTVSGSGRVEGRPDTVSFQVGLSTTAATATAALSENNVKMRALEASLARNGVAYSGMQTAGLSVNPNTNNEGVVTGFTVSDVLQVTMHDIARAGSAIQAAADVAGNGLQLYGVNFSISDQTGLLATARAKAMEDARLQASELARAAGASLGEVLRVTTHTSSPAVVYPTFGAVASPASVPLQRGSQPVSVHVTVTYRLN